LAGDDGEPIAAMSPATGIATFEETSSGTRMTAISQFLDLGQMETMMPWEWPKA